MSAPSPDEIARAVEAAGRDPARRAGRFVVIDELGRGGMGVVYRGWDPSLRRAVAIKRLVGPAASDARTLQRFEREARSAAALRHPGIVGVHEAGADSIGPYFVMDFVDGRDLERLLREGLGSGDAVRIVRDVARALHHAHEAGLVHRDVKPENILVDGAGRAQLADFGLVRDARATLELTGTGQMLGTLGYMAPEQLADGAATVGRAADVYALGGVLYRALCGRPPFGRATGPSLITKKVLGEAPPAPRSLRRAVHRDLENVVMRCLERSPERRYESAAALADDLDRWIAGEPVAARPPAAARSALRALGRHRTLVAVASSVAVTFAAAAVIFRGPPPAATEPSAPPALARESPTPEPSTRPRSETGADPAPRATEPVEAPAPLALGVEPWWTPAAEQLDCSRERGEPIAWKNEIGMRFALVPPGSFTMGSPADEAGRGDDETAHEVTITRAVWLGATEVTNAEFRRFRPGHATERYWGIPTDGHAQPVVNVSWEDARAFCAWLGEQEGEPDLYRLPTEAEWERAARAGTRTARWWGDDDAGAHRYANAMDPVTKRTFKEQARDGWTEDDGARVGAPVGRYPPNPWGLHDVVGNVWEWCADRYGPYSGDARRDPTGPDGGGERVFRGGSWINVAASCRAATRARFPPEHRGPIIGFRVCAVRVSARARGDAGATGRR